jgi:hypothetical protein
MTLKCTPTLRIVWESQMFKTLVENVDKHQLGPHDNIGKVLKFKGLKCPHIVHLNLKCMNYDSNKGWESNWEFDYWPQILLE